MMALDQDHPVEDLEPADSWALLAASELGRLAVSVGDIPEIFPINYYLHDRQVIFKTAQGSKLVHLTINRNVVLEADGYDDETAWSVIVKGTAKTIQDTELIEAARKLPLPSWIPTVKYLYVQITPHTISGRRFARGPETWQ
ncbi:MULTISPECIES: pyridoxamine 5'-phosphate oxidase family protein [Arthrobacter]|uniref:Pyridoxamine 5'-phosphate oxidase family protein n=2 Tax=Arthrobacter TaxID=1663 RepID=A0ABU9KJR9_9MICC|nr:pyridoxamine 5'-phosphate oxidase family protein [Arthrobacter sp. YJM1]MDP5225823.1 pyridoxamine 5'-phosphate oxidase family protein [Arthrobacter sp. YJM1]